MLKSKLFEFFSSLLRSIWDPCLGPLHCNKKKSKNVGFSLWGKEWNYSFAYFPCTIFSISRALLTVHIYIYILIGRPNFKVGPCTLRNVTKCNHFPYMANYYLSTWCEKLELIFCSWKVDRSIFCFLLISFMKKEHKSTFHTSRLLCRK